MVRPIPEVAGNNFASMLLAIALFVSISALVALCAKANHVRRRASPGKQTNNSPSAASKQLVANLNNKAIPFVSKNKGEEIEVVEIDDGFGEGGVWQRSILMGEKCQPPEFSGVIYYDECGKQLSELPPRSPRVSSPLPSFFSPAATYMQTS